MTSRELVKKIGSWLTIQTSASAKMTHFVRTRPITKQPDQRAGE